jgi:hypothetical protein
VPNNLLASRWIPTFIVALVSATILLYVATRFQSVVWFPELTAYRIGNAISLLFHEKDYIRPVQGLPIAILSKSIIWAILPFLPVISPQAISIYMFAYFGALILAAAIAILAAWPRMSGPQRIMVLLLFVCPWVLGGAPFDLIAEPDYWAGEWSYLIVSACLLAAAPKMPAWSIGAWLAVGVAMKITLIGIAPLFVLASQERSPRHIATICVSFIATFVLIDLVYMGGLSTGLRLLKFQLSFFAHPNDSVMWPDVVSVLISRPFLLALAAACAAALLFSTAPQFDRFAAFAWLCGFVYLIWRRPHDTSIASAATAMTFVTVYFVRTWNLTAVTLAVLLSGAAANGFDRTAWIADLARNGHKSQSITSPIPKISGMFFQPDNYWNAGLAVQAFGYNGELGFYYPIESTPNGKPKYQTGGKSFQALFPGVVMIADSAATLDVASKGLIAGVPLWWTRKDPVQPNSTAGSLDRLNAIINKAGAKIETFRIIVDGHPWLLQKAQVPQP